MYFHYYYNGLKYVGSVTLDFTDIGFKNDTTRELISETTYYLGGLNSSSIYSNQIYDYERGTKVYSGNATTWIGRIALAYLSDYGYAVDLSKCSKTLDNYSDSTCTSNNWMKAILVTSSWGWLLTPNSGSSSSAWYVTSDGPVHSGSDAYRANGVVPVLYLNANANIKSGTGTSSEPYQLSV